MKAPEKLHELYGETVSLMTPSGFSVVIRQQNGDDDDVITNASTASDGTSINKFIAAIIVDSDITPKGTLSLPEVLEMKLCDKYFILLASRIFSLGQILKFDFQWENISGVTPYEEDLSKYIWDYAAGKFPLKPDDEGYFEYRIKPHAFQKDKTRELVTRSGKKLKYSFVNGNGEKYLMNLPEESQSKNQELLARELYWWLEDRWTKVQNFRSFTPMDMADLRNDVNENDPTINLVTDLENPVTHVKIQYPIVGTTDFFFPREI
jgi:hypothetical protein